MENDIITDIQQKWSRELIEEISINNSFINLKKLPISAYVTYFQSKLLYYRIITNKRLMEMEIRIDPNKLFTKIDKKKNITA